MTDPAPLPLASNVVMDCFSLRLVLRIMGKRSRGPPPGKDEAAAHAMQRVFFVPEQAGSTRGVRAAITVQKPNRGPDLGMRLWVQGRPEMVALFATVVETSTVAEAS